MGVKSIAVKSVIGLIGVGGASGIIAHQLLAKQEEKKKENPSSIGDKLTTEGYILLNNESEHSEHWNNILNSYKEVVRSKEAFKFDTFDGNKPNGSDKEATDILKEHCQKALSKKETDSNSNSSFEKARKWCVKPISVSEVLKNKSIIALKTGNNADTDKKKWENKIKKHIDSTNNLSKINQLNLTSTSSQIAEGDYKIIQNKCDEIGKINNHTATFEDSLKLFELWCSDIQQ